MGKTMRKPIVNSRGVAWNFMVAVHEDAKSICVFHWL